MNYNGMTIDSTKGALRETIDKIAAMADQHTLIKEMSKTRSQKVSDAIKSITNPQTAKKTTDPAQTKDKMGGCGSKGVKQAGCGSKSVKQAGCCSSGVKKAAGDPIMTTAAGDPIMSKTSPDKKEPSTISPDQIKSSFGGFVNQGKKPVKKLVDDDKVSCIGDIYAIAEYLNSLEKKKF